MRVFSVCDKCTFIQNQLVKAFQFAMFHGRATRGGREYPHDAKTWANTPDPEPLKIVRTVRNIPPIARPSSHFVVCERVAEKLRDIPNIRVMPVVFTRLVDIPYEKGDHSWEDNFGDHDPNHYLRTMPDVAPLHNEIGPYYEVQTWRLADIVHLYSDTTTMELEAGTAPTTEIVSVCISRAALSDYPMVYGDLTGAIFLNERVLERIDNDIDRDFFNVRTFHV